MIRFLSETGGVPPERFTAMGRAFYQPVASNATPEGRQENRRVDIIVAEVPIFAEAAQGKPLEGPGSPTAPGAPAERDLGPGDGAAPPAGPAPVQPGLRSPVDKTPLQPAPSPEPETVAPAAGEASPAAQTPGATATPPAAASGETPAPPATDSPAAPLESRPELPPALPAPPAAPPSGS